MAWAPKVVVSMPAIVKKVTSHLDMVLAVTGTLGALSDRKRFSWFLTSATLKVIVKRNNFRPIMGSI